MVETCIVKEKQDYKQKLKTLKIEVNKLKGKEETSIQAFHLGHIFLHLGLLRLVIERSVAGLRTYHEMFISFVQNYAAVFMLKGK